MAGDHQLVPLLTQPHQHKTQQRRPRHIEPARPLPIGHLLRRRGLPRPRQPTQINLTPRHRHLPPHHLSRRATTNLAEPRTQPRMPHQHTSTRPQQPAIQRPIQHQRALRRIHISRRLIVKRVEQQPFLQREQRPHIRQRNISLQRLNLAKTQPAQPQIRRRMPTSTLAPRMSNQGLQHAEPQHRQTLHIVAVKQRIRPRPRRRQNRALGRVQRDRVDAQRMKDRHPLITARRQPAASSQRPGRSSGAAAGVAVFAAEAAQVVENDLRHPSRGQHRRGIGVQVSQQPIPQALTGDRAQLLLDLLDRPPQTRPARSHLIPRQHTRVNTHRMHRGEPANRARQITAAAVTAVPLHIHQHRTARRDTTLLPPPAHRQSQRRQQDVVDPGIKHRRDRGQHRPGPLPAQHPGQRPARGRGINPPIKSPPAQQRVRSSQNLLPPRQPRRMDRITSQISQMRRPAPERNRHPRQRRHTTSGVPGSIEIGQDDPPRHPVHGQMVNRPQHPLRAARTRIEPDNLNQHPSPRIQTIQRRSTLLTHDRFQLSAVQAADINPRHTIPGRDRPRLRNGQAPRTIPRCDQARPQHVVAVQNRLHHRQQPGPVKPRRRGEQHRLAEPAELLSPLTHPAHHRRRHHLTDPVHRILASTGRRHRNQRQIRHRRSLENIPRRQNQARNPSPRHQPHRQDAVPAQIKEPVINTDPLQAQYLSEDAAQNLLAPRPRLPVDRARGQVRCGQRRPVNLPVHRQRQRIKHHHRRGHHVIRQHLTRIPAQSLRIHPAHPRRRNDVSDQPPGTRRILGCHRHRLGNPGVRTEHRLDLTELDPEPADLHLLIGTANKHQLTIGVPAHHIPGPVHPLTTTTKRARHKPLRGQTRPAVVPAGQLNTRQIQLPRHPRRHRLQPPSST